METNESKDHTAGQTGAGAPPPPGYYGGHLPVPPPRHGRMSGLTIFLIILCGFLLLMVIGMAVSKSAEFAFGGDFSGKLSEKVVIPSKVKGADKLAIVPISGGIDGSGSHVSGEGMVLKIAKQLRQAGKDDKVRAVLIQMDSPGGGLTASDILRKEIMLLQEAGKKVVVCVGTLAASGGLYISAPADYIIAHPTSMVGSIGVIMFRFKFEELIRKLGIEYDPIKSTEMKDIGSPFRDLSENERKYFEDLIKTFNDRFISIVAEGRKLDVDKVRELANGKIYTADQALEYKLIDQIGYYDDALEKTKELANLEDPYVIKYTKPFEELGFLGSLLDDRASLSLDNVESLLRSMTGMESYPRVMALWDGKVE